jgi:FkbM family methyltransferase
MNPNAGLAGFARNIVRKFGYDVIHNQDLGSLLRYLDIDLLLDVGANVGQTHDKFRLAGYHGSMISFEPHPDCFGQLQNRPDKYRNWLRLNLALGPTDADQQLHFGPTSQQTSLLTSADSSGSVSIRVRALDNLWPELNLDRYQNVFLKTDAEGFDFQVLQGAKKHFSRIAGGMMELRPVPEYDAESPMHEVLNFLSQHDFAICRIDADTLIRDTGVCASFNVTFCQRKFLTKAGLA